MKFSKFGRATLAAVLSLGVAAAFTACGPNGYNNTVDYVYVTNAKTSQVNVYYTDAHSGALTQISGSPFSSGGTDPVALARTPDFKNLYVVNESDNAIVQFSIDAGSAKLTQQHSYTTPGTLPNSVSINSAGTLLFVTDRLAPNVTTGPGVLVVFPIGSDGSLGIAGREWTSVLLPVEHWSRRPDADRGERAYPEPDQCNVAWTILRLCRQPEHHQRPGRYFRLQRWHGRRPHLRALLVFGLHLRCDRKRHL